MEKTRRGVWDETFGLSGGTRWISPTSFSKCTRLGSKWTSECPPKLCLSAHLGFVMFYPFLFCPSDNMWRFWRADAPWRAHFSTVITPSWITQQISVEKCAHRDVSARREWQTTFKIVTWTIQSWTKHHNTADLAKYETKQNGICTYVV